MLHHHIGLALIEIEGDVIIAGDSHIPQQSEEAIERMIETGKSLGISKLGLNGDVWNVDYFSRFFNKQHDCSWADEEVVAEGVFRRLGDVFREIYIIPGNHPIRVNRKTENVWGLKELIKLTIPSDLDVKIVSSDRHRMIVNNNWLVCHPEEYSKKIGSIALQKSNMEEMNVVTAHSHTLSKTIIWEGGKARYAIDGGCLIDMNKVDYLKSSERTFPKWTVGFVILQWGLAPMIWTPGAPKIEEVRTRSVKGIKNGKEVTIW